VFHNNPAAIKLYEKRGFIEEGRCPRDVMMEDGTYLDLILIYRWVE